MYPYNYLPYIINIKYEANKILEVIDVLQYVDIKENITR